MNTMIKIFESKFLVGISNQISFERLIFDFGGLCIFVFGLGFCSVLF